MLPRSTVNYPKVGLEPAGSPVSLRSCRLDRLSRLGGTEGRKARRAREWGVGSGEQLAVSG